MNPFKNFLQTLRRYKVASALNIIGLSVAFASFMIIATQVKYDLTFDRHYKNTDRIFRVECHGLVEEGIYSPGITRPAAERILNSSPDIEQKGLIQSWSELTIYDQAVGESSEYGPNIVYKADLGALDIMELEFVLGSPERFTEPGKMLISEDVAQSVFAGVNPIGRNIIMGTATIFPHEVIGVYKNSPKNATLKPNSVIVFIANESLTSTENWSYNYYVRLNAAKNAKKVEQQMNDQFQAYTESDSKKVSFRLTPIAKIHFQEDTRYDRIEKGNATTVYSLLTIAILIIVIAMINFINFATSLVPVRIRGINTRKVLGESNASVRRNVIGEAVGMTLISFFISLFITELFATSSLSELITNRTNIGSDMQILGGTCIVAVITGLFAGIYPAFYSTSFPPALVLKGSFGLSPKGRHLRTTLIGFQYVISIALIIIAISIHVQNSYMQKFDMGFNSENILCSSINWKLSDQRETLGAKLKNNPAITDVTFAAGPIVSPVRNTLSRTYKGGELRFDCYPVAPNFLSFMGIKITEGRDFRESDEQKSDYALIFNTVAQQQNNLLIGKKMGDSLDMEIVGIAQNYHTQPLQFGISPFAFMVSKEFTKTWHGLGTMFVKINGADIAETLAYIEKTIKEIDPNSRYNPTFMDQEIGNLYKKEQNLSTLITLFSLLSVLISIVGVFGLITFETQYRRKEIGVRKVFGATIREVITMFNRGYIQIVTACFVIAAPVAYYIVKRWQEGFAYQAPVGWWIFAAALLSVLFITIITISAQSYRTATENPVNTLRSGE